MKPHKQVKPRQVNSSDMISFLLLVISYLFSGLSVCYTLYQSGPNSLLLYIVGILLLGTSFTGRIIAIKELGPNYSKNIECVEGGRLITTGVYSKIRHPLYVFYILEMIGFIVIKYNLISLLTLFIVILTTFHRITAEENALYHRFRNEFGEYRQRTGKIVPFVF